MFEKESQLPEEERMDFVSIVTPNHVHFEPAKLALENGFHVVCEKPLSFSLDEALQLQELVQKTGLTFALTHTYTGYPMIKQAREMCQTGTFGENQKGCRRISARMAFNSEEANWKSTGCLAN
jgi:predicted dehydrogenase